MTTSPPRPNRWALRAAVLGLFVLGACGGGETPGKAPLGASDTTTTPAKPTTTPAKPTTTGAAADRGIDFVAGSSVDLGDGWRIEPCESGPPLFCVRLRGETQGTVELLSSPVSTHSEITKVLDVGGTTKDALHAVAASFFAAFAADRPIGCGASYEVNPFGPLPSSVAATAGISYGFEGRRSGLVVERVRQFSTIVNEVFYLISISAIEDDSCMDDGELAELSVAQLAQLESALVGVIAVSKLP